MSKRNTNPKIEDAEYDVGYGKPPQHTRFPKGRSGNPSGRPKRKPTVYSELEQELSKMMDMTENGRRIRVSKRRAICKRLISASLQGNERATKQLLDIEQSGKNDNPDEKFVFVIEGENDP